jgi:hypothetical protein
MDVPVISKFSPIDGVRAQHFEHKSSRVALSTRLVGSNPIARSRFVLRCSYLAAPPQRRLPLVLPGEALGSSRISNWVQRTPMGGPAGLRMGIQDGLIAPGRRGTRLHEDRATPAAPRPKKRPVTSQMGSPIRRFAERVELCATSWTWQRGVCRRAQGIREPASLER